MALRHPSLFLYGFEVTILNSAIDFKAVSGGPTILATLNLGFYSLTSLGTEIARAMSAADPAHTYTVTVNRFVGGGTQNRVTITTNSSFFTLLFGSGPRASTSVAPLIGFNDTDYTGSTFYTGAQSAGIPLITEFAAGGFNFTPEHLNRKVFGAVNVAASGEKEAVVFQVQKFIEVEFKYEPEGPDNDPANFKLTNQWVALFDWAIQQKLFEFTPEVSNPSNFFEVTLETTAADGKGLGHKWVEMLPDFPGYWRTDKLKMRVRPPQTQFI